MKLLQYLNHNIWNILCSYCCGGFLCCIWRDLFFLLFSPILYLSYGVHLVIFRTVCTNSNITQYIVVLLKKVWYNSYMWYAATEMLLLCLALKHYIMISRSSSFYRLRYYASNHCYKEAYISSVFPWNIWQELQMKMSSLDTAIPRHIAVYIQRFII